jgi:hypothetical protein
MTDCVTGVFTKALPNAKVVALILSVDSAALSCRVRLLETLPALAAIVTAFAVNTEDTCAGNSTLVPFAGTVTNLGTTTAASLLERLTSCPPAGAGAFSVTVQESVPEPVTDAALQVSEFNSAVGEPFAINV